jgi:hypothetical protein
MWWCWWWLWWWLRLRFLQPRVWFGRSMGVVFVVLAVLLFEHSCVTNNRVLDCFPAI